MKTIDEIKADYREAITQLHLIDHEMGQLQREKDRLERELSEQQAKAAYIRECLAVTPEIEYAI